MKIDIEGEPIMRVDKVKYLGVLVDEKLNFNSHIESVISKMNQKLGVFYRLNKKLDDWSKIHLYKALISPQIDFCSTVLFLENNTQIKELQKVQNKFMRLIIKCNKYTPIKNMVGCLQWLTIKQRIVYNVLNFIYKMKHKLVPKYLTDEIKYVSETHSHQTRNRHNIILENAYMKSTQNSLLYNGVKEFNKLPVSIRSTTNIGEFKRYCTNYVRDAFF